MQKLENLTREQVVEGTPKDKIIIIKSIFSKESKLKLQPSKKESTGRYLGIEENVSEMEKLKRGYLPDASSSLTIKDGLVFNLEDPQDAADWEWVRHSKHIADNFDAAQSTGLSVAWFYVHRPGAESRKKLEEIQREYDIVTKIMQDTETNLYNRVRLMGMDMSGQPISDVKEYLLSAAKDRNRVAEVINIYENADISLKLMLYHGLDKGVIKFDGFAYKYNRILLGTTETLVMEYLKFHGNISVVKEIEKSIYPDKGEGKEAPVKTDPLAKAREAKAAKNKED